MSDGNPLIQKANTSGASFTSVVFNLQEHTGITLKASKSSGNFSLDVRLEFSNDSNTWVMTDEFNETLDQDSGPYGLDIQTGFVWGRLILDSIVGGPLDIEIASSRPITL